MLVGKLPMRAFFRRRKGGEAWRVFGSDAEPFRNSGEAFPYELHAVGDVVFLQGFYYDRPQGKDATVQPRSMLWN